jgi:outer membrane receptor protein involved in Fe transport
MKTKILIPLFIVGLLLSVLPLSAQNVELTGRVTDAQTGEPLIGVTVYNTQRRTGTTTNSTGHYTITLPSNRAMELVFSYVGYASETRELNIKSDKQLNIQLNPSTQNLREVQVYGTRHNFGAQSSQMSAIAVSAEQIRRMPVLLGETDVLKSLQRLPGVQSSGEGRAGIHVRGGENDQNLFSIDGITLYNAEHLQGFTSAINADVVNDVVLYKGAFPASFGGRLSSVVDVSLQEGDFEKTRASITAGMLASRFQMDGPLWKGHTSYNIAARVSYFSAIVKPMLEEVIYDNPGQMNDFSHMRYWDMNAKITHRFAENAKLSAIFYMGRDANNATPTETSQHYMYDKWSWNSKENKYESVSQGYIDKSNLSQTTNRWNNLLGGLSYTQQFSPSLRLDFSASYSGYDYRLDYATHTEHYVGIDIWNHGHEGAETYSQENVDNSTVYRSKVSDYSAKAQLTYTLQDKHEVHGGVQAGSVEVTPIVDIHHYEYHQQALADSMVWKVGLGDDRYKFSELEKQNSLTGKQRLNTFAAYVEDDWNITPSLKANLGLRLQGYQSDGETKMALEPRASLRLLMAKGVSLKASYARMSQGMQLLTSGNLVTPSEVWVPFYKGMDLAVSDQVSVGYNHDFNKGIQISVEGYYKWLDGVIDYRSGTTFMEASDWSNLIAQGKGRAYGVELMAQKTFGNTTGMVSYTWSKSLRTFDREGMELNNGREFYSIGDRRHNFNISITQRLSKNWDFSAAWTYQSGRRASLASSTFSSGMFDEYNNYYPQSSDDYEVDYTQNPAFSDRTITYEADSYFAHLVRVNTYHERNSYVMPAVHRLDISFSHHGSIGIGEMICDVGIYNLYCQQNISSVYWGYEKNRRALRGVCLFPIMPSISLTLKL